MTTTITEEGGDPASTIVMPAVGGEPETQPEVQVQPKQTPPVQHQCHVFGFYSYFQHPHKATFATHAAQRVSEQGKRVTLIGGDIERPDDLYIGLKIVVDFDGNIMKGKSIADLVMDMVSRSGPNTPQNSLAPLIQTVGNSITRRAVPVGDSFWYIAANSDFGSWKPVDLFFSHHYGDQVFRQAFWTLQSLNDYIMIDLPGGYNTMLRGLLPPTEKVFAFDRKHPNVKTYSSQFAENLKRQKLPYNRTYAVEPVEEKQVDAFLDKHFPKA